MGHEQKSAKTFDSYLGGYATQRRGIMLTWWGIMLDVVDTPYGGGVLC